MRIIAVANQKGGVGKTTTALAIANVLINEKKKVLFIDTDPQKNSTRVYQAKTEETATLYDIFYSGYDSKDCIQHTSYGDIIASDDELMNADALIKPTPKMYKYLKAAIKSLEGQYDYIVIDTPPHMGVLLGNVLMAAQDLIIPVTCDSFGIQGIIDFYNSIKEYTEDNESLSILGILKIKYKGRQTLTKDIEDNLLPKYAKQMNTKVFSETIRESVKCQEAQTLNMPLLEYAPKSTTAIDYIDFVNKNILKKRGK